MTKFNCQSGFSLVGALVLFAIVGIAAATLTQLQASGNIDKSLAESEALITNMERAIAIALAPRNSCRSLLGRRTINPDQPLTISGSTLFNRVTNLKELTDGVHPENSARRIGVRKIEISTQEKPSYQALAIIEFIGLNGASAFRAVPISLSVDSSNEIVECSTAPAYVDYSLKCNVDVTCLDNYPDPVLYPATKPLPPPGPTTCMHGFELNNLNNISFEIQTPDGLPTSEVVEIRIEFASYTAPNNFRISYSDTPLGEFDKYTFLQCNIRTADYGFPRITRPPEDSIRSRIVKLPKGVSKLKFEFPGPSPFFLKVNTGCNFTQPSVAPVLQSKLRTF